MPDQSHSSPLTKRSFQHEMESLVDRVCAAQKGLEFLYKRDSQGKLVTRQSRLADPSHGTAIKSFRRDKSKLPLKLWGKKPRNPCNMIKHRLLGFPTWPTLEIFCSH